MINILKDGISYQNLSENGRKMMQLNGYRYYLNETEIYKWQIIASGYKISDVLMRRTAITYKLYT